MKIRNGFVSNSSSSSFVIAAIPVSINDISKSDLNKYNYVVEGKELYEGDDIFEIDNLNILYFLKAASKIGLEFNIYKHYNDKLINNELDLSVVPKKGKLNLLELEQDYNSCDGYSALYSRYIYEDNLNEEYDREFNKMQRRDKLKKIKENED